MAVMAAREAAVVGHWVGQMVKQVETMAAVGCEEMMAATTATVAAAAVKQVETMAMTVEVAQRESPWRCDGLRAGLAAGGYGNCSKVDNTRRAP